MTCKCLDKRGLEALSRSLLALFPDRNKKSEAGRAGRAGKYWEAR